MLILPEGDRRMEYVKAACSIPSLLGGVHGLDRYQVSSWRSDYRRCLESIGKRIISIDCGHDARHTEPLECRGKRRDHCGGVAGRAAAEKPKTSIADCGARAASGHTAAPPSSVMNWRRFIRSPRRRARGERSVW